MGLESLQPISSVRWLMLWLAVCRHGLHSICLDSVRWPVGRLPSPGNVMAWSGGWGRLLILRHSWLLRPCGLSERQGRKGQYYHQDKDQNHEAISHFRSPFADS